MLTLDVFKSPRRLRVEKKRRMMERQKQKSELERLNLMYKDRQSKVRLLKRVEQTPSFMQDFEKMKELFKKPEPMFNDSLDPNKKEKKKNSNFNLGDFL
jgi:hypothetical protein